MIHHLLFSSKIMTNLGVQSHTHTHTHTHTPHTHTHHTHTTHTFKSKQWHLCIKLEIRKRWTRNNVEEHVEIKIKLKKSLLSRSTLKLSSVQCAKFTLLKTSANFKQKKKKKKKKIFWKWRQQFKRFKCNSCQFILSLQILFGSLTSTLEIFCLEKTISYLKTECNMNRTAVRESVCVCSLSHACMYVCYGVCGRTEAYSLH